MKVAIFNSKKDITMINQPKPIPNATEILIKIEASAICTWEQRVYTGAKSVDFPFIGGHEVAAEIIEMGDEVNRKIFKIGDKVVLGVFLACGDCYQCKTGNQQNCEHMNHSRKISNSDYYGLGGFSEYTVAKPENLFIYENLCPEEASLIEPVSCCLHSIENSELNFGDTVLVVGCGIMGLLHVQLALKKGAVVYAADFSNDRIALAKEFGAHAIINNKEENLYEKLKTLTNGKMVQHIFNTTAISSVAQEMMQYLSIRGKQTLYSSFYPDTNISLSPDRLHKKEYKIMGTANSNPRDFVRAIKLVENKIIDLKPFVSEVYSFDDIEEAMESAILGDKYRVVLRM